MSIEKLGPVDWQVQQLRFTTFVAASSSEVASQVRQWWTATTGESPEDVAERPKEGMLEISGSSLGGRITLRSERGPLVRIDWVLGPPSDWDAPTFPIVDTFAQAKEGFVGLVDRWCGLEDVPDSRRIAFGATLLQPTQSHADAYQLLDDLLPAVSVAPDSSDFLYQVNRRRPAGGEGTLVNRLSHWSAMQMSVQGIQVGGTPESLAGFQVTEPVYAARLRLDINTVPREDIVLSAAAQQEMFHSLVEYGEQIATQGDVP